jgi:pimeloyl-ACP methyl ester carboxylesterase
VNPDTREALLDGMRIAYQTLGEGPVDVVISAGSFSHTDVLWEDAVAALFLRRFAAFCRLIRFDVLGSSGSDRCECRSEGPAVRRPADCRRRCSGK